MFFFIMMFGMRMMFLFLVLFRLVGVKAGMMLLVLMMLLLFVMLGMLMLLLTALVSGSTTLITGSATHTLIAWLRLILISIFHD